MCRIKHSKRERRKQPWFCSTHSTTSFLPHCSDTIIVLLEENILLKMYGIFLANWTASVIGLKTFSVSQERLFSCCDIKDICAQRNTVHTELFNGELFRACYVTVILLVLERSTHRSLLPSTYFLCLIQYYMCTHSFFRSTHLISFFLVSSPLINIFSTAYLHFWSLLHFSFCFSTCTLAFTLSLRKSHPSHFVSPSFFHAALTPGPAIHLLPFMS